jgi:hypothetical protein
MSSIDSPPHIATPRGRPSRRRLAAWIAFGVAGLATGAVWATGFAEVGGATGTNVVSPIIAPSTPADHPASLAGVVTAGSALSYNWSGRWGAVADSNLFTVDLTGESASNTYNIAFLLTNGTALSSHGWTSLQLKVERVTAAGASCVASDFDGAQDPKVMAFDSEDAGVYWNALAGGEIYCLGVNVADGHDIAGTFLRRDSDTVAPTAYPRFVTTVDRAS